MDYFRYRTERAEVSERKLLAWAEIPEATLRKWKKCCGKAYEHNGWIPKDNWLTDDEKQAIIKFHFDHPLEGYRRLTCMMIDANVVAGSPCSVYRVLRDAEESLYSPHHAVEHRRCAPRR